VFNSGSSSGACESPYSGVERHVAALDMYTGSVDDKYYSYTWNNGGHDTYLKQISYPAGFLLKAGSASRMIYNEFRDGTWYLHVSKPGSSQDETVLANYIVWDTSDVDGDGKEEVFVSSTANGFAPPPTASMYNYYPEWKTRIWNWNESSKTFSSRGEVDGVLPYLLFRSREADKTSTQAFNFTIAHSYSNSELTFLGVHSNNPNKHVRIKLILK
jgi:hypothetical protein